MVKGERVKEDRLEEIRKSAEEIVDSFAEIEKDLPTQGETYYLQETLNVLREDENPSTKAELEEFRRKFLEIMPEKGEDGNLKVEVAKWTE